MKPFIGYHFFHGAGKIPPKEAYLRTDHALSVFTDQKCPADRAFLLDMRNDQGGSLEPVFQDICLKFGPVSHTTRGIVVGRGADYRAYQWRLDEKQFEEAFSLLDAIHEDNAAARARTSIQAFWNFKFVNPDTGQLLPDQENMPQIDIRLGRGSSLNLTTGKTASVNAWFLFPFEKPSPEFEQYALRFQKELIFKFSPKHWRMWKVYPVRGIWPKKFVPSWYTTK